MLGHRVINIQSTARVLVFAMVGAYCLPSPAGAQTANPQPQNPQVSNQSQGSSPASQPAQPSQQPSVSEGSAQAPQSGAESQPVQQPVTTYPDAAGAPQAPAGTNGAAPDAPQPKTQQSGQAQSEPQGAATAEKVNTAGGAAAKPAGVAIAPAKQHQTRSLLIKIGAFVAAGAAAGTVYALSRGTSSTPPGATSPNAVQKK
jgi:hypothetical protein